MDENLPYRKGLRLREYDYSRPGCYFVTVCTKVRRENILCWIEAPVGGGLRAAPSPDTRRRTGRTPVGAGAHAGPSSDTRRRTDRTPVGASARAGPSPDTRQRTDRTPVGGGLRAAPSPGHPHTDRPRIILTDTGQVVEESIVKMSEMNPCVEVDAYVVMPDHVHIILVLTTDEAGRRGGRPLQEIIGRFKSFTDHYYRNHEELCAPYLWQKSYYDHIIRTDEELQAVRRYIESNPQTWLETKGDEPWTR